MAVHGHRMLSDLAARSDGSQADQDAAIVFDPDHFATFGAPYAALGRLRRDAPVHPADLPGIEPRLWLCTSYVEASVVDAQPRIRRPGSSALYLNREV